MARDEHEAQHIVFDDVGVPGQLGGFGPLNHSLLIGGPVLLSEEDLAETRKGFATYGLRDAKRGTKAA